MSDGKQFAEPANSQGPAPPNHLGGEAGHRPCWAPVPVVPSIQAYIAEEVKACTVLKGEQLLMTGWHLGQGRGDMAAVGRVHPVCTGEGDALPEPT